MTLVLYNQLKDNWCVFPDEPVIGLGRAMSIGLDIHGGKSFMRRMRSSDDYHPDGFVAGQGHGDSWGLKLEICIRGYGGMGKVILGQLNPYSHRPV
jgi:hypothetical protein